VTLVTLAVALWEGRGDSFTGGPGAELAPWAAVVAAGGGLVLVAGVGASLAGLVVRVRRSQGVERAQLRWFLAGSAAAIAGVVVVFVVPSSPLQLAVTFASIVALPASAAMAILRHRLYELDLVVNRSLVWLTLTGLVVLAYLGIAATVAWLVGQRASSLVAVSTAVVVTALFGPVRHAVQRVVDRVTFGERADPYRVLADLGERLDAAGAGDDGLRDTVATLARSLRLDSVAIRRLDPRGDEQELASTGVPGHVEHVAVLRHRGTPVGTLVVGGRPPGDPITDRDRALVDQVARHLAAVVHAATLTAELQASHDALVRAREDERRRLRSDVHDGLGPSLASIAAGVEAARYGLAGDTATEEAAAVLERTLVETERAIATTRAIVQGLRPPTLDELGLDGALRERCAQLGGDRFQVSVTGDLSVLPAAVEVAALHVLEEAITNVARHARASRCEVRLEVRDGPGASHLLLSVVDDGCGLSGDDDRNGVGLGSMRRRVEHLGGDLELRSATGSGTQVRARMPLEGSP
jgi:two-component system NarL family sensor kinase